MGRPKGSINQRTSEQLESETRRCCRCGNVKPFSVFGPSSGTALGIKALCFPCRTKRKREKVYMMTAREYQWLIHRQEGRCAICGTAPPLDKPLCVDHCHKTGKIRGLLCHSCNMAIGQLKDNWRVLKSAYKYLKGHDKGKLEIVGECPKCESPIFGHKRYGANEDIPLPKYSCLCRCKYAMKRFRTGKWK